MVTRSYGNRSPKVEVRCELRTSIGDEHHGMPTLTVPGGIPACTNIGVELAGCANDVCDGCGFGVSVDVRVDPTCADADVVGLGHHVTGAQEEVQCFVDVAQVLTV